MSLENHPVSEIFPLMEGEQFDALVADIRDHGLRDPIVLHEGKILDGRNRYRACVKLGLEVRTEQWTPNGSPEAFVISHNLHRRHLNAGQRSMIAARIATRPWGTNQHFKEDGNPSSSLSRVEAAKLMNVNKHSVTLAKRIISKGTPEEIAAADAGEISVSTTAVLIQNGLSPAERSHRRTNPPPRKPPKLPPGKLSPDERLVRIRELAAEGHCANQIAQELGLSVEFVSRLAYEAGIVIYDRLLRSKRVNHNRVVEETVAAVSGLVIGLEMVDVSSLNANDIPAWVESLDESLPALVRLRKQLKERLNVKAA